MPQPRQHADHAARQRAYRARQAQARHAEHVAKGLPSAPPLPTLPSHARWQALIAHARLYLETAQEEMPAYYDERSEAWQQGDRAAALTDQLDCLEQALAALPL